MNYRMTQPFKPPFRINALIEEAGSLKVISTFQYLYSFFILFLFPWKCANHNDVVYKFPPSLVRSLFPIRFLGRISRRQLKENDTISNVSCFSINHFSNLKVAFILNNTSEFILQAEVFLKVSAEFASSITANTIKVQMPLPKYTTRYYCYYYI